jgi:hypothetical protein
LPLKPPEFSESTWLGATISVGGFLCGLVGVAAIIWHDPLTLLGIAAGSGWTLSIVFAVLYAGQRRRQAQIETELDASRQQAGEWSATANNVSRATHSVLQLVGLPPGPVRRRPRQKPAKGEDA